MARPIIEKIAVVGGGSSYTPELIDGFIQHEPDLQVGEIVLYDIDFERLKIVGGMAQRMVQHAELETRITLSLDRPAAIEGAARGVLMDGITGVDAFAFEEVAAHRGA